MAEAFLQLPRPERAEILAGLAPRLGRTPVVLEKDVWVCWTLAHLFTMPAGLPMAFKGGTSLSKVFDAIHRFSEDIDITINYRALDEDADSFAPSISKSKQKKLSDSLRHRVAEHITCVVMPHLTEALSLTYVEEGASVERVDEETVKISYPSAAIGADPYILDTVKIEFGGRSSTEPQGKHLVSPYLAASLPELAFPIASPFVLSPARTFWEKATLIHAECGRASLLASVERKSRHWYDLALLADGPIGREALQRPELLEDVVKHKKVFFGSATAKYDACLEGQLQLIPAATLNDALKKDYEAMKSAGMFYKAPPSFADILERLRALEATVNGSWRQRDSA